MIEIKGVDSAMIANNLTASMPMHPGEILRDELEARNVSQKAFSAQIGVRPSIISEVINGKRAVSTEYALLFEAALGIDADFWLKLQSDYNKEMVSQDKSFMARLGNIRKIASAL